MKTMTRFNTEDKNAYPAHAEQLPALRDTTLVDVRPAVVLASVPLAVIFQLGHSSTDINTS